MEAATGEVTRLLSEMRMGNSEAAGRLIPIVYDELRRLAGGIMAGERPGHTLQRTALVHEAYLRLMQGSAPPAENRAHFRSLAARSMRQVLVDYARRRLAGKRGGEAQRVEFEADLALTQQQATDVLALHEALDRLKALDERQSGILEKHYFAGMEVDEIAQALGISARTVKRELQTGRLFLKQQLGMRELDLP